VLHIRAGDMEGRWHALHAAALQVGRVCNRPFIPRPPRANALHCPRVRSQHDLMGLQQKQQSSCLAMLARAQEFYCNVLPHGTALQALAKAGQSTSCIT
jgi:hypothetical protein